MFKKLFSSHLWEVIKRRIYILMKSSADVDTANDDEDDPVRERGYEPVKSEQPEQDPDYQDDEELTEYQPQPWLQSFDELIRAGKERPDPQKVQQEMKVKIAEEEYEL